LGGLLLNLKDKKKGESLHRWSERKRWTQEEIEQLADELVDHMMENEKEILYNKFLHKHGVFKYSISLWEAKYQYFANAMDKVRLIAKERIIYDAYKGRCNSRFAIFLLGTRHNMREIMLHQVGGMNGAPIQLSNEEMINKIKTIAKDIFTEKELNEIAGNPKAIEYKKPEELKQELLIERKDPECEQ